MPKRPQSISKDTLHKLFSYQPTTGRFIRKTGGSGKNAGIVCLAGSDRPRLGTVVMIGGKIFLAHRLVWIYFHGEIPKSAITHKNRNIHDNRIENLQVGSWREIAKAARGPLSHATLLRSVAYDPDT